LRRRSYTCDGGGEAESKKNTYPLNLEQGNPRKQRPSKSQRKQNIKRAETLSNGGDVRGLVRRDVPGAPLLTRVERKKLESLGKKEKSSFCKSMGGEEEEKREKGQGGQEGKHVDLKNVSVCTPLPL